jgi:acetyltransferase-like isoleucine patch superfamily enzyme
VSLQTRILLSIRISFGKGTVVKPYAIIQTWKGKISIGRQCAISSFDHITNGDNDLIIGNYVRIGPSVTIMGGSRNYKKKDIPIIDQGSSHEGVKIGNDVLIGAGTVVLPGCDIGDGAVIGANSLVNKDISPYAIAAGVPVKIIGERE